MNLENHPFFKKYKYVKIILLVHLIFSFIIFVSMLVHGIEDKDVLGTFEKAFDNHKAFSNPEKYLKKETFVIDTVFIDIQTSSSQGKSTVKEITVLRGNLLHSTKKKELRFTGMNLNFFNDTYIVNENIKPIKVWRNTINDEVFLGNEREFERAKTNAISHIYFYFSIIPLFIFLLILKKKT